jgi:predicted AAA+ superfamily ATPase
MREYLPRIADRVVASALQTSGAVLIEGAKWCGKTWTAQQLAHSTLFMQDPDRTAAYVQTANTQPSLLLQGETPRLLDEWQMAPVLWDAVRFMVDHGGKPDSSFSPVRQSPPREPRHIRVPGESADARCVR